MDIARAVAGDIPRIIDMVVLLQASVRGPVAVDRAWTGGQIARLIGSAQGAVWVTGQGFLAAELAPTMISGDLVAFEHGWWAGDGKGLRLLRAYEAWAAAMGAVLIKLSTAWNGQDLGRLGYSRAELAWVRHL